MNLLVHNLTDDKNSGDGGGGNDDEDEDGNDVKNAQQQ